MAVGGEALPDAAPSDLPLALCVVPVADLGGVARHVLDVVRTGIPGYRLAVLCPDGPLVGRLRDAGATVAVGRIGPDAGVSRSVRTLRAAVARLHPAVVHSHLAYADVIVAATPLPARIVRVTSEHGIAGDDSVYHGSAWKSWLMARVHGARLRRFDGIIAVSAATKRAMIEKWAPSGDIRVVHNGVNAQGPQAAATSSLRVLALARLSPEKRIPQLIDAFAIVHAARPDARLTIAGVGDLEGELKRRVAELRLGDVIDFPGFVDPDEAMAGADVLAQLSVWENCSYSLLDAAARGMRVVASRVGGNPEIVDERGLVDADDVDAIAAALLDEGAVTTLDAWPTVAEMAAQIAGVYREAGAVSPASGSLPERVTIATNNGDIGGGEVMLLNIAAALETLGIRVTVVAPHSPGALAAAARHAGHNVVELEADDRREWMLALRAWDAKHREGLLWCNGLVPAAATAGHRNRIVHLHQRPTGAQKMLERVARVGALTTLVPSRSMTEAVAGSRIFSNWSHAVETAPQREPNGVPMTLGFLGRPSIDKGVHVLAQALGLLEAATPGRFRLLIAGEPRFVSEAAQRQVESALQPVAGFVDRPGWIAPSAFFEAIDLLVVPSIWPEPFGLVVTEAMSAFVPVIVSDAGALPELLADVPQDIFAADDAAALATAIAAKVERGLAEHAKENRAAWAAHYSPEAGTRATGTLLRALATAK